MNFPAFYVTVANIGLNLRFRPQTLRQNVSLGEQIKDLAANLLKLFIFGALRRDRIAHPIPIKVCLN